MSRAPSVHVMTRRFRRSRSAQTRYHDCGIAGSCGMGVGMVTRTARPLVVPRQRTRPLPHAHVDRQERRPVRPEIDELAEMNPRHLGMLMVRAMVVIIEK